MSYGEEPIILDQPEDDLDNHLIYSLIVKQLRTIKQRRQVIVGETQHEAQGSLQQRTVPDTICNVMEGGREAFDQRYRRISLESEAGTAARITRSA